MIRLKYKIDYKEYLASHYLHLRPRPFFKIVGIVILLLLLLVFVLIWSKPHAVKTMDYVFAGSWIYALLYYFVFVPYRIMKLYNQNKFREHEPEVEIDNTCLHLKSDLSDSRLPWDHFLKWKENKNLILLYVTESQFLVFPKKLFMSPEDLNEFKTILAERMKRMP